MLQSKSPKESTKKGVLGFANAIVETRPLFWQISCFKAEQRVAVVTGENLRHLTLNTITSNTEDCIVYGAKCEIDVPTKITTITKIMVVEEYPYVKNGYHLIISKVGL